MERGRFAYVPTMTNAREYSEVYNAFGLLRSPWNTDPIPFLTRHDHIFGYPNNRKPSGCKQYRDAVLQKSWWVVSFLCYTSAARGFRGSTIVTTML